MVDLRGNRYARSPEDLDKLAKECASILGPGRTGLAVVELAGSAELSDLARELERDVLDRAFGDKVPHTPDLMTYEYGPYEDRSLFLLAIDTESLATIGSVRIIPGVSNKTTDDLSRSGLLQPGTLEAVGCTAESTWDIATVAVRPKGGATSAWRATMALYRSMYTRALSSGIETWTSIIDNQVSQSYSNLGIPLRAIDGVPQLNYLGSEANAYFARVGDIRGSVTERALTCNPRVRERIHAMLNGAEFLPELEIVSV